MNRLIRSAHAWMLAVEQRRNRLADRLDGIALGRRLGRWMRR